MRFCTCPTVLAKNQAPSANRPSPMATNEIRFVAT